MSKMALMIDMGVTMSRVAYLPVKLREVLDDGTQTDRVHLGADILARVMAATRKYADRALNSETPYKVMLDNMVEELTVTLNDLKDLRDRVFPPPPQASDPQAAA